MATDQNFGYPDTSGLHQQKTIADNVIRAEIVFVGIVHDGCK